MPPRVVGKTREKPEVEFSVVGAWPSGLARRHEGKTNAQPTSCTFSTFKKRKHYDKAVEHVEQLSKITDWGNEANKQVRTKLQSVSDMMATLNAEHHVVLDHRLHHARERANDSEEGPSNTSPDAEGVLVCPLEHVEMVSHGGTATCKLELSDMHNSFGKCTLMVR